MNPLPKCVLPHNFPTVYDCHSATPLESISILFGAVNELINQYNKTVEQLNGFQVEEKAAREEFELKLTKVIKQFICDTEGKFSDLEATATNVINEAIQAGTVKITEAYDPETESLQMVIGGEV